PGSSPPTYHIVGLVRDAKFLQVREERTAAAARFSANESSATFLPIASLAVSQDSVPPPDLRIVLRSAVPPASLTHALTRAITEVAPASAVSYDAVSNYIDRLLVTERLMAWLSGCFGVLAMLIAAIGLYGVMSYLVTRRRIEIGVRMALGAAPRTIIRMMFAECGVLLAIGIAIGVALAGVTLALGIGTATAIFSVVYGVMLRPLPFREPERLVSIWLQRKLARNYPAAADALELRQLRGVFEDVALFEDVNLNLVGDGEPQRLQGASVSPNLFSVLGVAAALGRT